MCIWGNIGGHNITGTYHQVSDISVTLIGNKIVDHFNLDFTPGFIGLGKDICKTRQEKFKFGDLVRLILDILRCCVLLTLTLWRWWERYHQFWSAIGRNTRIWRMALPLLMLNIFLKNIKIYLYFLCFLSGQMAHVVQILSCGRRGSIYHAY